ncbi:MAG: DUF3310 domain-containing protein [Acinetobacter sp.]
MSSVVTKLENGDEVVESQIRQPVNPFDGQVGGSHYKQFQIQPVVLFDNFNLGFNEGNLIKYAMRHHDKDGRKDLDKVIHYADLMIQFNNPIGLFIPMDYIEHYVSVNGLTLYAREVIEEVSLWLMNRSNEHLRNIQKLTEVEIYENYR